MRDLRKIKEMYESGMTAREIAPVIGVSFRTILRDLKSVGAKVRNPGAETIYQLHDKDWLLSEYETGKSTNDIAADVGCSGKTVYSWLVKHGAEMRSVGSEVGHNRNTQEAKQKMSDAKRGKYFAEENPNWRGGKVHDPERNRYPAKMWSKQVRERDGSCVECGSLERLHAHHIKRWKDYPELRYELDNGITLCHECHEKAHGKGFKFRFINRNAESDTSALPL